MTVRLVEERAASDGAPPAAPDDTREMGRTALLYSLNI